MLLLPTPNLRVTTPQELRVFDKKSKMDSMNGQSYIFGAPNLQISIFSGTYLQIRTKISRKTDFPHFVSRHHVFQSHFSIYTA